MTLVPDQQEVQHALERAASSPELFCFLDYDGTLAPIAPRPELARPLARTETTLTRLVRLPGTDVAVVSGRPVADLLRILSIDGLFYVGLHGAEIRTPEGREMRLPVSSRAQSLLREWRGKLEALCSRFPGVWIEDKGLALACHDRQAPEEVAAQLDRFFSGLAAEFRAPSVPLELLHGKRVWELRPKGIDKGRAVLSILRTYRLTALPLYAGDDRTDEDAFAQLPEKAITIRIGEVDAPSRARYRIASPHEFKAFLDALVQRRQRYLAHS